MFNANENNANESMRRLRRLFGIIWTNIVRIYSLIRASIVYIIDQIEDRFSADAFIDWITGVSKFASGFVFKSLAVFSIVAEVGLAYLLGIPYWWSRSPVKAIFIAFIGHWLLVNVVYHYYKASKISPGIPPRGYYNVGVHEYCIQCMALRPPRTYHCYVCDHCVLGMDHHCAILNNCVGHYNHRHFYLFVVYILFGSFFYITTGWNIIYLLMVHNATQRKAGMGRFTNMLLGDIFQADYINEESSDIEKWASQITLIPLAQTFIMYWALMNIVMLLGAIVFTYRHATFISKAVTEKENRRNRNNGTNRRNPYDLGWKTNWKIFLGFSGYWSFFRRVILPSGHLPIGDGMNWNSIMKKNV